LTTTSAARDISPNQTRRRLARVASFAHGHAGAITAIIIFTLLVGAVAAAEPLLLKAVIDELLGKRRVRALVICVGVLLGLALIKDALSALSNWMSWRTRLDLQHRILDETVGRLHALSVAYHRTQPVGSLLTRLDRGVQGLVAVFSELTFAALPALVFLVMSVVLMFRLEWRMSLLVMLTVPLPALVALYAAPVQTDRDRTLLDRWSRIYARFNEVLSGIVTVKSFAMEQEEKQRFIRQVGDANNLVARGVGFDSRITAVQSLIVGVTRVGLLGVGAALAWHGQITVGTLLAFLSYMAGLFAPVQGLTGIYQTVRRGAVALETIFEILDHEDAIDDAPGATELGPVQGEIELENVWFGYQPSRFVLRGINLRVEPGQTVALVGPSGAGKTSLAVLLQRLYDPQEGAVRIDGVDLREVTQRSLRSQIGVVMQDALLFDDTIRANIAYGCPDATDAQIESAARGANAHDFIAGFADGYLHPVGERGGRLSAGQRQRIAIARALLRDPPIAILDEATSALDAESEALVQEALDRLLAGRTTLVIAHRLSTIVRADRIFVLRGGRIIEDGTHQELLSAGGYYASMFALHTRGFHPASVAAGG
jgi:ATP-binding cassette subfamily B protein